VRVYFSYIYVTVLYKESTETEIGVSLKLGDIAVALQSDWVPLAEHLNITEPEVIKIQTDIGSIVDQVVQCSPIYVLFLIFVSRIN